jgi:hypothetical protein
MTTQVLTHAKVRRTKINRSKIDTALAKLGTVVRVGAESPAVLNSPMAKGALAVLEEAVGTVAASARDKMLLMQALASATKRLRSDTSALVNAARAYEAAIQVVSRGDASVIVGTGLGVRGNRAPPASLGRVTAVRSKEGKQQAEAVVSWPAAPGASRYAIEVKNTPFAEEAWVPLPEATVRRRVIKGPAPGSQMLARVAAIASDGRRADWSDPVLVITR